MPINKVLFDNVGIDLTADTVTQASVATGKYVHLADGTIVQGTKTGGYAVIPVSSDETMGTVSGGGVAHGVITVTAIPTSSSYEFIDWTINGLQVSTSATYTFIPTGDTVIQANFDLGLAYRYIKWNITKRKSTDSETADALQLSRFVLCDSNNNEISWSVSTITTNLAGYTSAEGVEKILDTSVDTKYCTALWGSSTSGNCEIVITLNDDIYLSIYDRYRYYTANDAESRDPVSWVLYASKDGTTWDTIDTKNDLSITSNRKTLAGTWQMQFA